MDRPRRLALGLVGAALIGGVSQVDASIRPDVFDSDFGSAFRDLLPYGLFHLLPLLGGVVVLGVCAFTLRAGRPRLISPMVFGLLGVLMILTGMAGSVVDHFGDARLAGTVFEEGVWIYVCYGGILAALGAIVYWAPKLWGRRLDERKVLPLAALGFIATVLAALPYYVAGFAKQPAGVVEFDYDGPQGLWNAASAVGHLLMLLTVLAFAGLAIASWRSRGGEHPGDDPWDAQTLEWATSSPAPLGHIAQHHTNASPEHQIDPNPEPAPDETARAEVRG
jgi:heme/copper-type cytochrome/quinol oxidase subunit 1